MSMSKPASDSKRKRDMGEEPTDRLLDGIPDDRALSLRLHIEQGANGNGVFRANNRTKRACIAIEGEAGAVGDISRLLEDSSGKDDVWLSLTYELQYAGGAPVEMRNHGRHPDVLNVMEPSGAQRTSVTFPVSNFVIDTRANEPALKKGSVRSRPLYTGKYLDIKERQQDAAGEREQVCADLKISTNVTSRQHEGLEFQWHCTLRCDLGEGQGVSECTATSETFTYVARQLKNEGSQKKQRSRKASEDEESDSDMDFQEDTVPANFVRRSTRKRNAPAYRQEDVAMELDEPVLAKPEGTPVAEMQRSLPNGSIPHLPQNMQLEELPLLSREASASFGDARQLARNYSMTQVARSNPVPRNNPQINLGRTVSFNAEEEEILRAPCALGRNLCRTESIDRLFGETGASLLEDLATPGSSEAQDKQGLDLAKSDSQLALSRGGSWGEFFEQLVQGEPTQNA